MPRFKASIVKESRNKESKFLSKGKNFVGIAFFDSPNFHNLSKSKKKKFVKNILKNKQRSELSQKFQFQKKERIIVNQTGYYGLDKTLFDDKIKMPSHLVDRKKRLI